MKKTLLLLPVIAGLAFLTAACAKPPTEAVDAAKAALSAAKAAEAAEYAPASLSKAEEAVTVLETELKTQADKFALMRSYTRALELAGAAKTAAEKAAADAATGKEAAKNEATTLIAGVKTAVEEVKTLITTAPKGKGTQADIEAMKADLAGVESGVADLDSTFDGGRYKEAKAKAEAAQQTLDRIKADIQAAIDAKKAARGR